MSAMS